MNKDEKELQELIQTDEVICRISCRYDDLSDKLRKLGKDRLLYLLNKDDEDKSEYLYPFKEYSKELAHIAKVLVESDSYCNSKELYKISNDCRSYRLWFESLDKLLKVYANIQPLQVREEEKDGEKVLFWDSEVQDLLTMSMRGKLFSMLRVYRASTLTGIFESEGRCVMSEFVAFMNEKKEEEEQAKREREDIN